MLTDALLAYFHFFSIIALVSLLAAELALCRPDAAPARLERLRTVDGFYGMSAMLVLGSGAARVWLGAKGSSFYLGNPVFYTKVGIFLLVGLLSIYPTMQFFRWSAALKRDTQFMPSAAQLDRVRLTLKVQLLLVAFLPFLATLMARGIGV